MAFRSGLEERVADLLVELGISYEYETTKIDYTIEHVYTPDFILPNGVVLETKGFWEPEDRRKILYFRDVAVGWRRWRDEEGR